MKSHVLSEDSENVKMESEPAQNSVSAVKSIDSTIFDSFKGLTSAEEVERVKSGLRLIQHLARSQNNDQRDKEVKYVIKRLVRGVGASTTTSRAGFFTTLVGFLQTVNSEELEAKSVLDIAAKQLHVGKSVNNKEDADAIVGQILTCGALIRSKKIFADTQEGLERLCQTLIAASKHRTYHHALANTFLAEVFENLSETQFTEIVWPIISSELCQSWEKQTIHTLHSLIAAVKKFPTTFTPQFLKSNFGGNSLLNARSANQLFKLFWENTSASAIAHPSFESFGNYIASSKYLETFWLTEVDGSIKSPTKLREIGTLKILSDILGAADPEKFKISKFLTKNFVNMMVESLKKVKFKKEDTLKAFYDAFLEALFKWTGKVKDDEEKVEIIRKLIFHPGSVNLEKYTSQRVIHQIITNLGEDGVKQTFDVYKKIFLANIQKSQDDSDFEWSNAERQCAGYMLQHLMGHKNVQAALEWRQEQLKFFMTCALFYTNDGEKIVSKKEDNEKITADLAAQMKNVFYSSLQHKLPRLKDERNILFSLVNCCDEVLQKKNPNKFLRNSVEEKILKAWKEMHAEVLKDKNAENKLKLVFHILLLHMGLQLFREPEMAENAIWDLEKCMAKTNQQGKKKAGGKSKSSGGDGNEEPEWIEVVVDLFLHLLSQNTSSLRNVVNAMFPHLCDSLSLTAVHQILSVLDMQDGKNPLSDAADQEDENLDDEDEDEKESDKSDEDESDVDMENNDDDDDDEDEELEEEEEEESTYTDVLRNAVSKALIGDRADDEVSVDLNDMDEEEGKRLDEALSNIFKTMMKPKQYKKTKGYRVETTTTMHFRIRVLDLIEIYIQHKPNLLIMVEIMITLYNIIEHCADAELKPLANKVEKVLGKLTALRHFVTIEDITEKNISDYLRIVIDRKVNAPIFEVHNKMKAKCCVFLIACTKVLRDKIGDSEAPSDVVNLLEDYLDDFIKSRNPTLTSTILNDVFKMRWTGIWQLASHLATNGLSQSTRTYRRIQVIEIIDTLYKNHELIRQDQKLSKKPLKLIEKQIQAVVQSLLDVENVSLKEFNTLLNTLSSVCRCHTKTGLTSHLDNSTLCENIQTIRKKIKLENLQSYGRFCSAYNIKMIRNDEVSNQNLKNHSKLTNGHASVVLHNGDHQETAEDESSDENIQHTKKKKKNAEKNGNVVIANGGKKRKAPSNAVVDKRKEKRLRKEERMKALSKGLGDFNNSAATGLDASSSDE